MVLAGIYRVHNSRIDWGRIDKDDFERAVEAVLMKEHTHGQQTVVVPDGRGGDGGIDIAIKLDGVVIHVFQLKYFPQGFIGEFGKSRQPQIKGSFETAMRNHNPQKWTLVIPAKPHVNEISYIDKLAAGLGVEVDIMGPTTLDVLMSKHPDIERAILRNDVLEILATMGQEKAALPGPADLRERVEGVLAVAGPRSLYWESVIKAGGGRYSESYRELRSDAMEKEPIHTLLTVRDSELLDPDTQKRLERLAGYGTLDPVTLPPGSVTMTRTGPPWVSNPTVNENDEFLIRSDPHEDLTGQRAELSFFDESGQLVQQCAGTVEALVSGTRGIQIRVSFWCVVHADIAHPLHSEGSEQGDFKMVIKRAGQNIESVSKAWRAACNVLNAQTAVIRIIGLPDVHMPFNGAGHTDQSTQHFHELINDLEVIHRSNPSVDIVFPESLDDDERTMLRVLRLLLEGKPTRIPGHEEFLLPLDNVEGQLDELMVSDEGVLQVRLPGSPFNVAGVHAMVGPAFLRCERAEVRNRAEIEKHIESGSTDPILVSFAAMPGHSFEMYPGSEVLDADQLPELAEWFTTAESAGNSGIPS